MNAERLGEHGLEPSFDEPAPVVRHEGVVAEVAGTEITPHDFTDGDDGGKLVFARAHPVSDAGRLLEALQITIECVSGSRRRSPVPVQGPAPPHSGQKLVAASAGWSFEKAAS
jgi:hypothetical protein